jgi:hypothetical protein
MVRMISSIYNNIYTVFESRWKMNNKVPNFASTNPKEVRYVVKRLYQARGACLSPYNDLFRWPL